MSRKRLTSDSDTKSIIAALEDIESKLATDDADLLEEAQDAMDDEVADEAEEVKAEDEVVIGDPTDEADDVLEDDAEAIVEDEVEAVAESVEEPVDAMDQNERANANWPLSQAQREMMASRLLKLAKILLK